jgi:hypothetical protein
MVWRFGLELWVEDVWDGFARDCFVDLGWVSWLFI